MAFVGSLLLAMLFIADWLHSLIGPLGGYFRAVGVL
jgi:hypothetical protein